MLFRHTAPLAAPLRRISDKQMSSYDVAIVGGGIVGLAVGRELIRQDRNKRVIVLEKEEKVAMHQSGHNSGVVHAGIYYPPGSIMAKLCVEGLHATYAYCKEHDIPYKMCGKLIVATDQGQVCRLEDLYQRALVNGVPDVEWIDNNSDIQAIQPGLAKATKAIWSPKTGIVDWQRVANSYANEIYNHERGSIRTSFTLTHVEQDVANGPAYPISHVITCAGLQSDRVAAEMFGSDRSPQIVPVRGEYYLVSDSTLASSVKTNIYPVPDADLPFLGVHITPRIDGEVWIGPNAVLALDREGYSLTDFNLKDTVDLIWRSGFPRFVFRHLRSSVAELCGSVSKMVYVRRVKRFLPHIQMSDVGRCSQQSAGVRAQAMTSDGRLIHDFVFTSQVRDEASELCQRLQFLNGKVLHCRNAPSPAATSALPIAKYIVSEAHTVFGW